MTSLQSILHKPMGNLTQWEQALAREYRELTAAGKIATGAVSDGANWRRTSDRAIAS